MNNRKKCLMAIGSAFCLASGMAQPVGQWDFENGNLNATTTGGQPLTYLDAATPSGVSFGTTTSFGIPDIGGTAAKVMKVNGFTAPSGLGMPVTANPNGGGGLVNEWTLIMDVLFPGTSDKKWRGLIETDGRQIEADADLFVNDADQIGVSGNYAGNVTPDQWHRIAFVIDAANNTIRKYIDGQYVGRQDMGNAPQGGIDGRWALSPSSGAELFNDNNGEVAPVYVNSIQLRDSALTTGEIMALGGPSAAGVAQTIPASPAYIESSTPELNATGVVPQPDISAVLNAGDSTVSSSSVKLLFDNAPVNAQVTDNGGSFSLAYSVPNILDPNSVHTAGVVYSENGTLKTNSFSFTVASYQKIKLPAPIYLQTFDNVDEGSLPAGWSATNHTDVDVEGPDLDSLHSDTYRDWVVVSADRLLSLKKGIFDMNSISLNGTFISTLGSNNMLYAESDSRSGNQVQVVFTEDYDLTGKTNIFVAFNSMYEQNQDNINSLEYSIDQGKTWLPLLYMIDDKNQAGDLVRKADGSIDAVATLNKAQSDSAYAAPYGTYIGAAVSQDLAPFISGRIDDDAKESKRIELIRAVKADNQAKVRFRFMQAGTASWYWGVDDFGIYTINAPTITVQPAPITLSYGESTNLTVTATGAPPLTYQWYLNGAAIAGATGSTLNLNSVTAANAGDYKVVVSNGDGPSSSNPAHVTVVVAPQITVQPKAVLTSAGSPVNLSVSALGQQPLSFQWQKDGANIAGANGATLSIGSSATGDSGQYKVVITNAAGTATSAVVPVMVNASAVTNQLVVHLALDGSSTDSSGHGNDGTPNGAPTFQTGKIGQAVKVTTMKDGSQFDYISLGYPEDLQFGDTNDFSVSMWVNYTEGEDDPPWISNKNWNSSGNVGWGIFTQGGGNFRVNVTGTGGTKMDTSATPKIRDGNWHHIAVSFWRGVATMVYADGQLVATTPFATTGTIDTADDGYAVNIGQDGTGGYTDGGSAQLVALIDDVGIWRRALTAQEIAAIYAQGNQGKDLSTAAVSSGGGNIQITGIQRSGANLVFSVSGTGPFQLQKKGTLGDATWTNVGSAVTSGNFSVPTDGSYAFFRVMKP